MLQKILFEPDSSWTAPVMADLPSWKDAKRVGIDTETCDPSLRELGPGVRRGGRVVGVSFAIEDGPAYYLPIGHATGTNLNSSSVLSYLKDQALHFSGILVGANLAYDLDYLAELGVVFRNIQWFRDIQVADPLINELHFRYSLDAIAERWQCPLKVEGTLREAAHSFGVDPKSGLWKLDPRFVGQYAEADARNPLMVLRRQEREIEEQGLWDIYNLESKVLPVLVKMRRRGVAIDFAKLHEIREWAKGQMSTEFAKIKAATGCSIDSGDLALATALKPIVEMCGLKVGKTPTGKPNIDAKLLATSSHPVVLSLGRCRKLHKLVRDFCASVERYATNGRIHCTFNQLKKSKESDEDGDETSGAAYGRLSSEHPNLQQQPARDDFAKEWRSIYVADEGKLWCSCDYSQQEPRITTHYAALCSCPGGRRAAQRYCDDPMTDAYTLITEITGLGELYGRDKGRTYAKTISLGLAYGMGGGKLARSLGLPTDTKTLDNGNVITIAGPEAQRILDQFNEHAGYIRALAKRVQAKADKTGVIKTLGGRNCHFPTKETGGYDWTHKGLNRLIQGSAADQTKMAMVAADAEGLRLQLQVHDELCLSVRDDVEACRLGEVMRNAVPLLVPMRVDVEVGKNWGYATKVTQSANS